MASLTDCYSCECLIAASESRCPFCGASQRNTTAPSWLAVGITLGLTFGLGTLSCAGDDGETSESTMTTTQDPSGNADAVTYGGPDSLSDSGTTDADTDTTTTTTDSTTTTTTTGTSTTDGTSTSTTDDSSNADAVTYGGPDSLTDTDWTASDS